MRDNPLQFAVVREDPRLEAMVLAEIEPPRRALLVASGGCTALSLQALFPDASFALVDPNPAQLAHVRRKVDALALPADVRKRAFGIGESGADDLSQQGNFESLFRGLRGFVHDFVAGGETWRRFFRATPGERQTVLADVAACRYWPVAFELFFSDDLLHAIFGTAATQHAERGSYPAYFRRAIERGLARDDAAVNPFLHHVLLGHYLDDPSSLPPFLAAPPAGFRFEYVVGTLESAADLAASCALVHLSNVFDWMDDASAGATGRAIAARTRPGTVVLVRQLNNRRDVRRHLPGFRWDDARGAAMLASDRSLFYERIHVGTKE